MTYDEAVAAGRTMGMPEAEVAAWLRYMDEVGWTFANGAPVHRLNYRRPLRMWHVTERRLAEERAGRPTGRADALEEARRVGRERQEARREARRLGLAATPEGWTLCGERCARALPCGCAAGVAIPPAHAAVPHPPEECPRFQQKGGAA